MSIQLTVALQPTSNTNPKSCYIVYVRLVHGDADAFSTAKFGPFDSSTLKARQEHAGDLESVLRVIESAADYDSECYHELPNWSMVGDGWDNDSTTDHQFKAAHYGHHVRYYDANGIEFEVAYTLATQ